MITEAHVGFKRLQVLLELKEYVHPSSQGGPENPNTSIELRDACLSWEVLHIHDGKKTDKKLNDPSREPKNSIEHIQCLHNLNLSVKRGELIGVAGGVGSGKTSLISALMGEVGRQ